MDSHNCNVSTHLMPECDLMLVVLCRRLQGLTIFGLVELKKVKEASFLAQCDPVKRGPQFKLNKSVRFSLSNHPIFIEDFVYLDALVVVVWAEGDAEAVAALLQLGLTLSRSGDHAHPVE